MLLCLFRLTAFVAKMFCQAQNIVDGLDLATDIAKSVDWLSKQTKSDGSFEKSSYRSYNSVTAFYFCFFNIT